MLPLQQKRLLMRALVYEAPKVMTMREVPTPSPSPDEVLIRVAYSGICGSELSGFLGQNSLRSPPLVFGHEMSGCEESRWRSTPSAQHRPAGTAWPAPPRVDRWSSSGCTRTKRHCPSTPSSGQRLPSSECSPTPVSYTHLTLPTNREV